MPNYQNGKIYKLWSPTQNLCYYGSTTQTLAQRLGTHKTDYKAFIKGTVKSELTFYQILECGDYLIEIMELVPCNNNEQLVARQAYYIKNNECVNIKIDAQYNATYRLNNKEDNNTTKADNNIKMTCNCGCILNKSSMYYHIKTKKHLYLMGH
jgi:hypothetical protein